MRTPEERRSKRTRKPPSKLSPASVSPRKRRRLVAEARKGTPVSERKETVRNQDCGECAMCLDMVKFGRTGRWKQRCRVKM